MKLKLEEKERESQSYKKECQDLQEKVCNQTTLNNNIRFIHSRCLVGLFTFELSFKGKSLYDDNTTLALLLKERSELTSHVQLLEKQLKEKGEGSASGDDAVKQSRQIVQLEAEIKNYVQQLHVRALK